MGKALLLDPSQGPLTQTAFLASRNQVGTFLRPSPYSAVRAVMLGVCP